MAALCVVTADSPVKFSVGHGHAMRTCHRSTWCARTQAAATVVGELLAQRAQQATVDGVHWERKRGQRYHGKIAVLLTALKVGGVQLV